VIPVHELLARIRWDPEFGKGRWEIAYLDHSRPELVRVPITEVRFPPDEHFMFETVDEEGVARSIPFHRIREVRRDGKVAWSRESGAAAG
jgi:uncharacterized protein (UPF0248 family)